MPSRKSTAKPPKKRYIKVHNDGTVWGKGWMRGGEPDGYFEWFRKDGSRMRSGSFTMGKQSGDWTTYDRAGRVVKVTRMK